MNTASTRAQGDTPAYVRVYRYVQYLAQEKIRVCGVWRDPACHDDWVGKILSLRQWNMTSSRRFLVIPPTEVVDLALFCGQSHECYLGCSSARQLRGNASSEPSHTHPGSRISLSQVLLCTPNSASAKRVRTPGAAGFDGAWTLGTRRHYITLPK